MKKILSVILSAALMFGGLGVNKVGASRFDPYKPPAWGYIDVIGNTEYIETSGQRLPSHIDILSEKHYAIIQYYRDGWWYKRQICSIDGTDWWICGITYGNGSLNVSSTTKFPNSVMEIPDPKDASPTLIMTRTGYRIYRSLNEIVSDNHLTYIDTFKEPDYNNRVQKITYTLNEDFTIKFYNRQYNYYTGDAYNIYYNRWTIRNPKFGLSGVIGPAAVSERQPDGTWVSYCNWTTYYF